MVDSDMSKVEPTTPLSTGLNCSPSSCFLPNCFLADHGQQSRHRQPRNQIALYIVSISRASPKFRRRKSRLIVPTAILATCPELVLVDIRNVWCGQPVGIGVRLGSPINNHGQVVWVRGKSLRGFDQRRVFWSAIPLITSFMFSGCGVAAWGCWWHLRPSDSTVAHVRLCLRVLAASSFFD